MELINTVEQKVVKDLDITFTNGFMMSVTVDETVGDFMEQVGSTLRVFNAERPSLVDPAGKVPAERTTINLANVLAIQERERTVTEATPEQKADWAKSYKDLKNGN